MNSMYQFISVVLCIVVFGSAVAVTFGMLDINKRKEDAIVADAADKASIHSQMGMEKDDKQYVQVNSNEVYGSILAIADADDEVVVYIGNARISDDDMEKIRNRKKNVVSELKEGSVQTITTDAFHTMTKISIFSRFTSKGFKIYE